MFAFVDTRTWIRGAALAALLVVPQRSLAAQAEQTQFELFPNPAVFRCLAEFPDDPSRRPRRSSR